MKKRKLKKFLGKEVYVVLSNKVAYPEVIYTHNNGLGFHDKDYYFFSVLQTWVPLNHIIEVRIRK